MSSAEQTGLTIVGAAIGGYFFGPMGAMYGASIGYTLGMSSLSTTLPPSDGPRLSDLKVQANTYGWNIPKSFGTIGHNGALIWSSGIREKKKTDQIEQGGKGAPSVTQEQNTYTYSASFAVLFHDGPIKAVRRIYANEFLVYDAGDFGEYETMTDFELADWITTKLQGLGKGAGEVTIYSGTETQSPDPTIQSYEGAGNVPGFRGFAYLVFTDMQLAKFGNRIPQIRVEYVATIEDPDTSTTLVKTTDYSDSSEGFYLFDRAPSIDRDGTQHIFSAHNSPSTFVLGFTYYKLMPTGTASYQSYFEVDWNEDRQMPHASCEIPMLFILDADSYDTTIYQPNGSIHTQGELVSFVLPGLDFEYVNNYQYTNYFQLGDNFKGKIFYWGDGAGIFRLYHYQKFIEVSLLGEVSTGVNVWYSDLSVNDGTSNSGVHAFAASDSYLYVVYRDGTVRQYDHDGGLLNEWTPSPTMTLGGERNGVQVDRDDEDVIYVKSGTTFFRFSGGAWQSLGSGFGFTSEAEPYAVFTNMLIFPKLSSAEVRFYTLGDISRTSESLDVVVGDLLGQCGLSPSDYDVTALSSVEVNGFTRSSVSAPSKSIELLMQAYQFSCYEDESKLIFNLRGSSVDKSIDSGDFGAGINNSHEQLYSQELLDDQNLPLVVNVSYIDPYHEYDVSAQSSRRSKIVDTEQIINIDLPLALDADDARQIAEKIHSAIWTARTSYKEISLPLKYLDIAPTDIIDFAVDSKYNRIRVTSCNIGEFIELGGMSERQVDYSSIISGEQRPISYKGNNFPGATECYFINCPALRNEDGDTGFYLAAHGYMPSWRGCVVFAQSPSGGWSQLTSVVNPATVGVATTVLSDADSSIIDFASTVMIRMRYGSPSSSTLAGVLADKSVNAALLGREGSWEIIQFITADDNGDGTFELSGFVRGQNGTEWAMPLHSVGDIFILLTEDTISRGYTKETDISYLFRAVSIGDEFQSGLDYQFTNTAEAMKPFSPAHLDVIDNNDGTYTINCTRRARVFGEWRDYVDVPLVESTERYRINVSYDGTVFSTTTVTSLPAIVNGVPGYSVSVAQLSDFYGAGEETFAVMGGNLIAATYNPSDKSAFITLSNGNRTATGTGGGWKSVRANTGVSFGKWYWEVKVTSFDSGVMVGIGKSSAGLTSYCGADANGWSYNWGGNIYHSAGATAYGSTFSVNDVISVALDMDSGEVWFAKNGVWQNSGNPETGANPAFTGITGPIFPQDSPYGITAMISNFGNTDFDYDPPFGFAPGVF